MSPNGVEHSPRPPFRLENGQAAVRKCGREDFKRIRCRRIYNQVVPRDPLFELPGIIKISGRVKDRQSGKIRRRLWPSTACGHHVVRANETANDSASYMTRRPEDNSFQPTIDHERIARSLSGPDAARRTTRKRPSRCHPAIGMRP